MAPSSDPPSSSIVTNNTNTDNTKNTNIPYTRISADSFEDLNHFINIITDAFHATALTNAFITDNDGTNPPSHSIPRERRERHFAKGIIESATSGAELVQAGNWSAIALWEAPNFQGTAFIDSKAQPGALTREWRARVKAAKAKYVAAEPEPSTSTSTPASSSTTDSEASGSSSSDSCANGDHTQGSYEQPEQQPRIRPYYHLSFLARNPSRPRVPGSLNAVITPFLERARAEHVPAWLEATSRQAVKLYERYGFRVVEEIVVGKDKVDAHGWPTPDDSGEGVTAWAMIYDPHLRE
ncbi:hypothetical protein KCU88_g3790, partial [Aureobasidium melanogenum]